MKKTKKRKIKRTKVDFSNIAIPLPPPKVNASDVPNDIDIVCPMCREHWANAHIAFDMPISPEHFAVREDLKNKITFQKSGLPVCPLCGFKYNPAAMYGLIMSTMAKKKAGQGAWAGSIYKKGGVLDA